MMDWPTPEAERKRVTRRRGEGDRRARLVNGQYRRKKRRSARRRVREWRIKIVETLPAAVLGSARTARFVNGRSLVTQGLGNAARPRRKLQPRCSEFCAGKDS